MVIIDTTTHRSPNYDQRTGGIDGIVLHSGEGSRAGDLSWLCSPRSKVSAHYYVCRDGTIYQLVADQLRAWHSGTAEWNDQAIGIETEHTTGQDWPPTQLATLAALCYKLIQTYRIAESRIVAHRWIAPGRKLDPSDWPDPALRSWISALYRAPEQERSRMYVVVSGIDFAAVREGPGRQHPIAWGGACTLAPGRLIECDKVVTGESIGGNAAWAHWAPGGFIHTSLLKEE